MREKKWDIFISHASEDKETIARPLADTLRRSGIKVWLDEHELKIGDSLSEKIDEGLSESQFGAVVLSPAFFAKHWPKKELSGLRAREEEGQKVILPIWHEVDKPTVREFSPILADALAASTEQGIDCVVKSILDVIFAPTSDSPSAKNPSVARRLIEILEAGPKKEAFVDFLRFHLPRTGRYLGWCGPLVLEKYEFYGMEFDAYAPDVGHGCRLALVSFTEAWKDPFDEDQEAGTALSIRREIQHTIARIKSSKEQFEGDKEAQLNLRNFLLGFDLRLMSSLNDLSGIPTEAKNLIIVAAVNDVLHFRIFGGDGKVVVDTDEKKLPEQARQIENLRKQLQFLWPPHELTRRAKDRIAIAVTSIVGHVLLFPQDRSKLYFSWVPQLAFYVFAGRRSTIDASTARHETWSKFLKENKDIQVKSYDYILDAFL